MIERHLPYTLSPSSCSSRNNPLQIPQKRFVHPYQRIKVAKQERGVVQGDDGHRGVFGEEAEGVCVGLLRGGG